MVLWTVQKVEIFTRNGSLKMVVKRLSFLYLRTKSHKL